MRDLLWNSRLLGAMQAHGCLTEDEITVLTDWANGRSIAYTAITHHMSESKIDKIRKRLRQKYDSIQVYAELPPRKTPS